MSFYEKRIPVTNFQAVNLGARKFTIAELSIITNDFSASHKIGDGYFGTLYKGILSDGTLLAVWRSKPDSYSKNLKNIQAEVISTTIFVI